MNRNMNARRILRLAATLSIALVGCDPKPPRPTLAADVVHFNGRVFDGARGTAVVGYQVRLQYLDRDISGDVSSDGHFALGPLPLNTDYTVVIRAEGYRSFESHNAGLSNGGLVKYNDAYLFPTDLQSQDVTIRVTLSDDLALPSGLLRARPTTGSAFYDSADESPLGVDDQLWENDDDLQVRSVTGPLTDGVATLSGSALVYGVSYTLSVFGVPGYRVAGEAGADSETAFVAGETGLLAVTLDPVSASPIAVAYDATRAGFSESGEAVVVFNQPIEFAPPEAARRFVERVDGELAVSPVDGDADDQRNELAEDTSGDAAERGTKMTVEGNVLRVQWSPGTALTSRDPDDPVRVVEYGGFEDVSVRPVGGDQSEAVSLGSFFNTLTVQLSP